MTARESWRDVYVRTAGSQKSHVGAPGWSRWVNRPLGRVIAASAFRMNASPNQVTVVSTVLTVAALAALAVVRPGWVASPVIAIVLLLAYALDSADGQLARLQGGGSLAGEWLDHVTDAVKTTGIHLAVAICWFRFFGLAPGWLLVPLGFALVASVFFFSVILSEQLRRSHGAGSSRRPVAPGTRAPVLRSVLVLPADYGLLCLVMVLLPWRPVFVAVYTVLLAFGVFFLLGGWRNWFTEMRRLG